ncbi:MAG: hypothetical protein ABI605_13585 [Rhizobacter sp.]
MTYAVIKDNHITLAGNRYFVGNADAVLIGSIGKKATPLIGQNKLEPQDHIPAPKLAGCIRVLPPISIDTSQTKKSDFTAAVSGSLKVIGVSVSGGNIYDELASNKLKLVELLVEEGDMVKAVNSAPKVVDSLVSYGNDARIAHRTLFVMEAEMAQSFTAGGNVEASVDAAGIVSVTASAGASSGKTTIVKLSPGTCLGYMLLNFSWNKGKTQIENPRVDEQG